MEQAAATAEDVQALLRFIVQCKVASLDAIRAVASLTQKGFFSEQQLREAGDEALQHIEDAMVRAAVGKKIEGKRKRGAKAEAKGKRPRSSTSATSAASAASASGGNVPSMPTDNELSQISEQDIRRVAVRTKRSPVMHVWAAAVALKLGYSWDEALSLSSGIATLFAIYKGRAIGLIDKHKDKDKELQSAEENAPSDVDEHEEHDVAETKEHPPETVRFMGQDLRILKSADNKTRSWSKSGPVNPQRAYNYMKKTFGSDFNAVFKAMKLLADELPAASLEESTGYDVYARFRPQVSRGTAGWGQVTQLALSTVLDVRDDVRQELNRTGSSSTEAHNRHISHSAAESK